MAELPVVEQPVHRCAALLEHLARRMRARSEDVLATVGLRPRHLICLTVLRDHGDSGQRLLADVLHIDQTNLVGLLNELEEEALIVRRRAAEDRRRHIVELTPAGHAKLAEAELTLAAVENEILAGLTHAQRESLYQLLWRASDGLTRAATPDAGACQPAASSNST